jgi:hypothetical protein
MVFEVIIRIISFVHVPSNNLMAYHIKTSQNLATGLNQHSSLLFFQKQIIFYSTFSNFFKFYLTKSNLKIRAMN